MQGIVMEIKFGEGGKVLTVVISEPWLPYRPERGFATEDEVADYDEASKEYQKQLREWENLKLGNIEFSYKEK